MNIQIRLKMSNSQITKDPIREDILAGARILFERFGFKKTTMEDIARQVGKSKSALYYYYKTKEEIFEEVVLEDIDRQRMQAEEAISKVESAAEKFRVLFISLLSSIKEKTDKFSIFRSDLYENPLLFLSIGKQRDGYLEEILKDILILGISRGEIKVMSNAEMDVWARVTNLTIRAIGGKIFLEDDFAYIEHHLGFLADTMINGVLQKS